MLVAAAFVPVPPLLVPEVAGGSAAADEPLRTAAAAALTRALATEPHEIIVIGTADVAGEVRGSWDWRGFGVCLPPSPAKRRLPHALAIGDWLLDRHDGPKPARSFHAVTAELSASDCADVGRELVEGTNRVALLLCGDGSACRSEKAPGSFDPAASTWDGAALAALREPDRTGLLALDATLGRQLLAAGRAPWQVLAGAAEDGSYTGELLAEGDPWGVAYLVAIWRRAAGR